MNMVYENLITDANNLINTFTISYNVGAYSSELFSSTYDELTGWLRNALKQIEATETEGKDSNLYKALRRFRGRAGDITLQEFQGIIYQLQETH